MHRRTAAPAHRAATRAAARARLECRRHSPTSERSTHPGRAGRRGLDVAQAAPRWRAAGFEDQPMRARCGATSAQQLQPFAGQLGEQHRSGDVAARPREARDEPSDRVAADREHNRDRRGRVPGRERRTVPSATITAPAAANKSAASSGNRSECPSAQRYSIATFSAFDQPTRSSRWRKAAKYGCRASDASTSEEPDHRHCRLLRARRERPRRRRAAEQRDELAPLHSITSSARGSSIGGTVEAERLCGLEVDH